ncbi:MAG: lytic transglycosylase domain-containing protein [Alphaproteobacteria bacterium]|nr:lytic transglycosylase domain-containing protein [Alphaproteobacteria bacterium]
MLAEATKSATATVIAALQRASAATGSDFHYLLGTAMRESGLRPQAHSSASSAAGLFQFVEQTWFGLLKEYGSRHGLGSYASAINRGSDGHYRADNLTDRHAILALRNDPQVSALMAGEYAKQTQATMQNVLGRPVCDGELYAAHFLGPESACRLIEMNASAPNSIAASVFPQAAAANKNVFYNPDGTPKSIGEVYNWAVNGPPGVPNVPTPQPLAVASASQSAVRADNAGVLALLWSQPETGYFAGGHHGPPNLLASGMLDVLSSLVADGREQS